MSEEISNERNKNAKKSWLIYPKCGDMYSLQWRVPFNGKRKGRKALFHL